MSLLLEIKMKSNLKGIKSINNYLNQWLQENNFDCTVMFGTDFSYDFLNNMITYSLFLTECFYTDFIDVYKSCNKDIEVQDPFILAFFHELGHFETQDLFEDSEWEAYMKLCKRIKRKLHVGLKDLKKYWYSPIELEATNWACQYIIDNKEKIDNFWNGFQPYLFNFYSVNNIENN